MRSRVLVPALVVLGAAGLAGGALPTWWTVRWSQPVLGEQSATLAGREVSPALLALALIALAGIGAVAASRGWLRRCIGVLIAAAGALGVVATVVAAGSTPRDQVLETNPLAESVSDGHLQLLGPLISGTGGLLLVAAGVLVIAGRFAGQGMGGRFDRGAAAGAPAGGLRGDGRNDGNDGGDDDPSAWWKALDSGHDPTDPPGGRDR